MMGPTRTGTPHLFSGAVVVAVAAAALFAGRMVAIHLEHKRLHAVAPKTFQLKDQGLVFQRAAVRAPEVLPLYGSSELLSPLAEKAGVFFRNAPPGFQVEPVANVGTTPPIMLHELPDLRPESRAGRAEL